MSLKKYIAASARLGYDNETLLVPGVPEAPDQQLAGDALARYMAWLGQRSVAGVVVNSMRATA
ncbi:hypothetical protein [Pinirhizobacter sp.]|uniref:hypothetical protein n=1 Tax=Pinirhizobacter sp. TaxID=2950432 RepID=UPI002F42B3C8